MASTIGPRWMTRLRPLNEMGYGTLFLLSATCHRGRRKTQLIPADRRGRQGHATPPTCERLTTSLLSWFEDRKSTRLNSSHSQISYAVFCLKKKKTARSLRDTSYTSCR